MKSVVIKNALTNDIREIVRYCWKFHFWNLNGYLDLSAVEEIVGKGNEKAKIHVEFK